MAKRSGMYKSEKRRKELSRQKKKEEKRQRRLNKSLAPSAGSEAADLPGTEQDANPDAPDTDTPEEDIE